MYSGWLIKDASVTQLKNIFGVKHPDFIGHHVTFMFGKDSSMPPEADIEVVGHCVTKTVECFVVTVNGSMMRPDGSIYHLTWSLDKSKGAKPVDSNKAIENEGFKHLEHPVRLQVTPQIFKF